ncbi:MAG: class I SAM-dependent methyltransferase [Actinobacteria bacterium]|nr:class I SAM-dependent methyltransferase [Actinomycetota bacterium]
MARPPASNLSDGGHRAKSHIGSKTRGTTGVNRLRRVDRWILHTQCSYLRSVESPLCIDLGYGREPWTTAEWHSRLRQHVRPDVTVVGVEIDPERVAAAQSASVSGLSFVVGGFEIPTGGRAVHVLRALNVLRQYDESEVQPAWTLMARALAPGGVLIDGTCDEVGRLATWLAVGADENRLPVAQTFTVSTQLSTLERPSKWATRLPKSLIHRNVPGHAIHQFFADFDATWSAHAALSVFSPRQRFIAAVRQLRELGWPVRDDEHRWRLGEMTIDADAVCN